jgi:hypothetical protein
MEDQMPFPMGMWHHGPIQLIEAGAPERTMCDSVSNAHPFPPAVLFSQLEMNLQGASKLATDHSGER